MERVKLLKRVFFDGKVLLPGTVIAVQDGYPLKRRRIARDLLFEEDRYTPGGTCRVYQEVME